MTSQKKSYTNADIIKRFDTTDKRLEVMDSRLQAVETWKISQDAGKAAVDEYRRQESSDRTTKDRDSMVQTIKDLTPYIIAILVAGAALLYTHSGGH